MASVPSVAVIVTVGAVVSEGTEKVLGVDAALEFPAASKILFVPTPIVMVFPVFDVHSKVYTFLLILTALKVDAVVGDVQWALVISLSVKLASGTGTSLRVNVKVITVASLSAPDVMLPAA